MSTQSYLVSPGSPLTLDSGAPVGSGDQVKVDPENTHDARLIESGRLVEVKAKPKSTTRKKTEE